MRHANQTYQTGNYLEFFRSTQNVWDNCMKEDKREIMKLVKERSEKESYMSHTSRNEEEGEVSIRRLSQALEPGRFLELIEADPNYASGRNAMKPSNLREWREVFKAIKEGLRLRYYGGKKKLY